VTGGPAGGDGTTAAPARAGAAGRGPEADGTTAAPARAGAAGRGPDGDATTAAPARAGAAGPGPDAVGGTPAAAKARRGIVARVRRGLAGARPKRGPSRYRTAFFLLAVVGILAAGGWLLYGSRFLVVRSVQVTGTHLVPAAEVLAAAAIPPGQPLIRVDTAAAASRVERITQVQSAQVSRQWPDGVLITVHERTAALAIPLVGGGFALVDSAGVVVQQVRAQPPGIPRFIPAGPLAGNPGVRAAASVLRQLPAGIARRVTSVTVPTVDAVTLHLARRITVDWGSTGGSAQKARELAILMHTHARFYDVSAPGTAATG
jgi:cell division protein FtsQ